MSFERPTLSELIARTRADTESRLGSGPLLPVSNAAVLSTVLAGAAYALHGHLDWIAREAPRAIVVGGVPQPPFGAG